MGLPVAAFEGGGPSDIIEDGKNGLLLRFDMFN
jgi:glycosyltransferase involved in cell wall biosynthesis